MSTVKIIFIGMIKNESEIIERCLKNLLPFVDAFCITDTGSTDNTIEKCLEFFTSHHLKNYKICEDKKFINFGINRTQSFRNAKSFIMNDLGWDLETTFGLLIDADMILKVNEKFNRNILIKFDECRMMQKTRENLEYYNTRIIRMSKEWICRGVTHEFWAMCMPTSTIPNKTHNQAVIQSDIWIDDVSDGGCKNDKLERDIRLLTEGLNDPEDEIIKSRYYFYLAQSYVGVKKYEKAIEFYKKRIEYGGWHEELWCSYFYIASCLRSMEAPLVEIEEWCLKAFEINRNRSESLCFLCELFYKKGNFEKAWQYLNMGIDILKPEKDMVNVDNNVYDYLFLIFKVFLTLKLYPENDIVPLCIEILNKVDKADLLLILSTCIKKLGGISVEKEILVSEGDLNCSMFVEKDHINFVKNMIMYRTGENKKAINLMTEYKLEQLRFICYNNITYYFCKLEYGTFNYETSTFNKIGNIDSLSDVNIPYCDQNGEIRFVKNTEKDFGALSLKRFNSILPAVLHNNNLYFYLSVIVNNTTISFIVKTNLDLSEKVITNPFYIEQKTIEHCLSFMISSEGFISLFYYDTNNSVYKVAQLKNKIDQLEFL